MVTEKITCSAAKSSFKLALAGLALTSLLYLLIYISGDYVWIIVTFLFFLQGVFVVSICLGITGLCQVLLSHATLKGSVRAISAVVISAVFIAVTLTLI